MLFSLFRDWMVTHKLDWPRQCKCFPLLSLVTLPHGGSSCGSACWDKGSIHWSPWQTAGNPTSLLAGETYFCCVQPLRSHSLCVYVCVLVQEALKIELLTLLLKVWLRLRRRLWVQARGPRLGPQHSHKKLDVDVNVCNVGTPAHWSASLADWWAPGQWGTPSQNIRWRMRGQLLASAYTYMVVCTTPHIFTYYTCAHTHTHTIF